MTIPRIILALAMTALVLGFCAAWHERCSTPASALPTVRDGGAAPVDIETRPAALNPLDTQLGQARVPGARPAGRTGNTAVAGETSSAAASDPVLRDAPVSCCGRNQTEGMDGAKAAGRVAGDVSPAAVLTTSRVFRVSGYCSCFLCCNKHPWEKGYGIAASGTKAGPGTIAADWSVLPRGTTLRLSVHGPVYTVQDRGGAIRGNRLDVWFESHQAAKKYGVKYLRIIVLPPGKAL